ncbi:MAG: hypothetical protein ACREGH_03280 [Minisyncoccia bacterium]
MTFPQFVSQFSTLINTAITALAAVAVFIFLFGLMRFMFTLSADAHAHKKAQSFMLWGLVALFVIFALGGILNFFANDFFGTTVSSGGTNADVNTP